MSVDSDSNSQTKPGAAADPTSMLAAFWAQWLEQSTRGTQALLEITQGIGDPQQTRERQQRWLETAAESFDSFLRTPPFMELMRQQAQGGHGLEKDAGPGRQGRGPPPRHAVG